MAPLLQPTPDFREVFEHQARNPSSSSSWPPEDVAKHLERLQKHHLHVSESETSWLSLEDMPALACIASMLSPGDHICPQAASWSYYHALPFDDVRIYPHCRTVIPKTLAHTLHAVGMAWAMPTIPPSPIMVLSLHAHEYPLPAIHQALNFAGVRQAPVIFVAHTTKDFHPLPNVTTFAQVGLSYGIRSQRLSTKHPSEIYSVLSEATQLARAGKGPACIELVTDPSPAVGAAETT